MQVNNSLIFFHSHNSRYLLRKPPDCHHERRQNHKCHESDCPPCSIRCSKVMSCSHICEAICHSAVRTEIIENVSSIHKNNVSFV
jgi:hypothetical protein